MYASLSNLGPSVTQGDKILEGDLDSDGEEGEGGLPQMEIVKNDQQGQNKTSRLERCSVDLINMQQSTLCKQNVGDL